MKVVLNSKIHRAWITGTNTEYVGSIIIDSALMDKVDLWEYEKVLICKRHKRRPMGNLRDHRQAGVRHIVGAGSGRSAVREKAIA